MLLDFFILEGKTDIRQKKGRMTCCFWEERFFPRRSDKTHKDELSLKLYTTVPLKIEVVYFEKTKKKNIYIY